DVRARGHARRCRPRAVHLAEHAVEVERERGHLDYALVVAWPFVTRAVAIDLDPVALGIAQVERLAYQVIGRASEAPAGLGHAAERLPEVGTARHEHGKVKEARGAVRAPRGVRVAGELQNHRSVRRPEPNRLTLALEYLEPECSLVEGALGVEVGHGQVDRADVRLGRQRHVHQPYAASATGPAVSAMSARTCATSSCVSESAIPPSS